MDTIPDRSGVRPLFVVGAACALLLILGVGARHAAGDDPPPESDGYYYYDVPWGTPLVVPAPGVLAEHPNDVCGGACPQEWDAYWGTFTLREDGSFEYLPPPWWFGELYGYIGRRYDVHYCQWPNLCVNGGSIIIFVYDTPQGTDRQYVMRSNGRVQVSRTDGLLDGVVDRGGAPLTIEVTSLPQRGDLDWNEDGSFTYTGTGGFPGPGAVGEDSFKFIVKNGHWASPPSTVRFTVHGTRYAATDLGSLPGLSAWVYPTAISPTGEVVGEWEGYPDGVRRAFRWQRPHRLAPGVMTELPGVPGSTSSSPTAINAFGVVSGVSNTPAGQHAAAWYAGRTIDLSTLDPPGDSGALDVNADFEIVGYSGDGGFLGRDRGMDRLVPPFLGNSPAAINDGGIIVGSFFDTTLHTNRAYAFVRQGNRIPDGLFGGFNNLFPAQGDSSAAVSINEFNEVLGTRTDPVTDEDGAFVFLPNPAFGLSAGMNLLPGWSNVIRITNDRRGRILGRRTLQISGEFGSTGPEPALWENGVVSPSLDLLLPGNSACTRLLEATDINDAGQIVGFGLFADGSLRGVILDPIDIDKDTDGDGLPDAWELNGVPVVGEGPYPLPGADPLHKDIYVEVDSMDGFLQFPADLNQVIAAFAAAPVANPDGVGGITLHLEIDPADQLIPEDDWSDEPLVHDWQTKFDDVKRVFFGSSDERTEHTPAYLDAKKKAFRYCVFADEFDAQQHTGLAELGGNDFMVTLGQFAVRDAAGRIISVGTSSQNTGTFMHELGHTLGLKHGGCQEDRRAGNRYNFKPNYHSVMSYTWQFRGLIDNRFTESTAGDYAAYERGWRLDYSQSAFPPLDEASLNEADDVGIGGDETVRVPITLPGGPPDRVFVAERGFVDWDHDMAPDTQPVAVDVNHLRLSEPASTGDLLEGTRDWPALLYSFRDSKDAADGVHTNTTAHDELSRDILLSLSSIGDCPGDANGDRVVGFADITSALASWGVLYLPERISGLGDSNHDGTVDFGDITATLAAWGLPCS